MASATPSPPQQQPWWSHRLRLLSARLAGINTITITWSPRGTAGLATSRLLCWPPWLPAKAAGGGGIRAAEQRHGENCGAGCPQAGLPWPWQPCPHLPARPWLLTCGS